MKEVVDSIRVVAVVVHHLAGVLVLKFVYIFI
jgi:hypothetical protein